jgi:hypothetical protein
VAERGEPLKDSDLKLCIKTLLLVGMRFILVERYIACYIRHSEHLIWKLHDYTHSLYWDTAYGSADLSACLHRRTKTGCI